MSQNEIRTLILDQEQCKYKMNWTVFWSTSRDLNLVILGFKCENILNNTLISVKSLFWPFSSSLLFFHFLISVWWFFACLFFFNNTQFLLRFFPHIHHPLFTIYILPFSQFLLRTAFSLILFVFIFSDKPSVTHNIPQNFVTLFCHLQQPHKSPLHPPKMHNKWHKQCPIQARTILRTQYIPGYPSLNTTRLHLAQLESGYQPAAPDPPLTDEWYGRILMQTPPWHGSNHSYQR